MNYWLLRHVFSKIFIPGMLALPDSRKLRIRSNKFGTEAGSKFSTFSAFKGTQSLPKNEYYDHVYGTLPESG